MGPGHAIIKRIPPFPAVGMRLIQALDDDSADIGGIVGMIQSDVGISAEIIRLSNSAAAAAKHRITTVRQGVLTLGINQIRRIAMAATVSSYVAPIARNRPLLNAWKHSVATAQLSAMLASAVKRDAEKAYTSALLSDIGLVGLMLMYPAQYSILLSSATSIRCLLDSERTISGLSHCEAGEQLAGQWSFPDDIRQVVAYHHNPPAEATEPAAIAHWAGRLVSALGYPLGAIVEDLAGVATLVPPQLRTLLPEDISELAPALDQAVGDAVSSLVPC